MRLIHTGDLHLDASFVTAGMRSGHGNRRRQGLRDVFMGILQRAREWSADAVLIAGDLFEEDRVTRDTLAFLRQAFESIRPIPIFIAPGNRDPYTASSPYAVEPWPANVFMFRQPAWTAYALKNEPLTVHGFAFDGPDISSNPFNTPRIAADGRVHIALAHGSAIGSLPPSKSALAPFQPDKFLTPNLHYLALGHHHASMWLAPNAWYAGAPEGRDYYEPGVHHFLQVEITPQPQAPPLLRVTPVPSSQCLYHAKSLDVSNASSPDQIIQLIREVAEESRFTHIARITLQGACASELRGELPAIYDASAEHFEYLDLVDETESLEDFQYLGRENTALGAFVHRLNREIADAPDEYRKLVLTRARDAGLAAYRGRALSIRGIQGLTL